MLKNTVWSFSTVAALLIESQVGKPPSRGDEVRTEIVSAYQRALDALQQGDADAAMKMDTDDWVSITVGQKPRTRQEMEPFTLKTAV